MIGIFGGTFDPPHLGHLILADEALGRCGLDSVRWVLTGEPPHKPEQPITSVEHRLEMVKLAIAADPHFELSRVEIDRPGPHYAAESMQLISDQEPDHRFAYLMGMDSLRDLVNWHRPEQLVDLSEAIVVLNRRDIEVELDHLDDRVHGLQSKLHFLEVPLIDIASSDIRRRVKTGAPYRYLLPAGVAEYIQSQELYR